MAEKEGLIKRFEELLEEGKQVFQKHNYEEGKFYSSPSKAEYSKFLTECLHLIRLALTMSSEHYKILVKLTEGERAQDQTYKFDFIYGVLEAAYKDYKEEIAWNEY